MSRELRTSPQLAPYRQLRICPACHRLRGPCGHPTEQRCACADSESDETWPRFDFNTAAELCRCCGTELLRSGSRWSVWFCGDCKELVGALNGRHGRCVVPIGRHSFHAGYMLDGEQVKNAVDVLAFVDGMRGISEAMSVVREWSRIAVARNLEAIGLDPGFDEIGLVDYLGVLRGKVHLKKQRFQEMIRFMIEHVREEGREGESSQTRIGLAPGTARELDVAPMTTNRVRFLSDGETIARPVVSSLELWNAASGQRESVLDLLDVSGGAGSMAIHPSGERVLWGGRDGPSWLIDTARSDLLRLDLPPDAEAYLTAESPGLGSFGSVTREDGTWEDLSRRHSPYRMACDVAVSSSWERAAIAYGQAYAIVWDLDRGEILSCLGDEGSAGPPIRIYRVAVTDDGELIATVDSALRARVWTLDGEEVFRASLEHDPHRDALDRPADMPARGRHGGLGAVTFAPGGSRLVVADGPGVRVWDLESGRERSSWVGHGARHPIFGHYRGMPLIHDICFCEDASRALTVGVDATLRVWEPGSGEQIWAVRPDPCCIEFADIAPDGRHVVWSGCPGMRVYRID